MSSSEDEDSYHDAISTNGPPGLNTDSPVSTQTPKPVAKQSVADKFLSRIAGGDSQTTSHRSSHKKESNVKAIGQKLASKFGDNKVSSKDEKSLKGGFKDEAHVDENPSGFVLINKFKASKEPASSGKPKPDASEDPRQLADDNKTVGSGGSPRTDEIAEEINFVDASAVDTFNRDDPEIEGEAVQLGAAAAEDLDLALTEHEQYYAQGDHDTGYNENTENIYEAVFTGSCSTSRESSLKPGEADSYSITADQQLRAAGTGNSRVFDENATYEWKRKEAKKKSKALKRPPTLGKEHGSSGNPFVHHDQFEDPSRGAFPSATEEKIGHVNPFHFPDGSTRSDEDSDGSSCFTDSTFNSDYSDYENEAAVSEEFDPNKPLPPKPVKNPHQNHVKDLANVLLLNQKKLLQVKDKLDKADDALQPATVLQSIKYRASRKQPSLPQNPKNMSDNQIKIRGVLKSLIDNEKNYQESLETLLSEKYMKEILANTKGPEVKIVFDKLADIYNLHQMFKIELAEKLRLWNEREEIGCIYNMFSSPMAKSFYSEYVNNYEMASEMIKEAENSKPAFRDFLLKQQMESSSRLPLSGLMLTPIQRFPQFIMIIKDFLKYTPRDHHDREQLQEAVTCIENVTHELNESKRRSEQIYHGQKILGKLAAKIPQEKNVFLIRQDDMDQLSQNSAGGQVVKTRRLFLMKDRLISVQVTNREQDGLTVERYTYKWHQKLENLLLTTSAITPDMYTKLDMKTSGTTISSPKTELTEDDPYSVASELTDMMHDITVIAKVHQLVSTLRLTHTGLSEDQLNTLLTRLQQQIQGKDYQLQMLNSSAIIIVDRQRNNKKYVFSAANSRVKQEWCIDFMMAKHALDVVNIPSWHKSDKDKSELCQPAMMMKHITIDMQRTFTKMKCAVRVYFPTRTEGSVEHLWIWSSSEGQGQVSVVSLHTTKPALIESFQGAKTEVVTAETVPGFATETDSEAAFAEDTVWTSTVDMELLVYSLSEKSHECHRKPAHTFRVGFVVLVMKYIDDNVFCGTRSGHLVVFTRNDVGVWSERTRVVLGLDPVTSILCVGNNLWAACGDQIYIVDIDTCLIKEKVDPPLTFTDGQQIRFNQMVKAGVGVWTSYLMRPNISLYHSESRKFLQDVNVTTAINEFISVYSSTKQERRDYEVTCFMASLGLLWVGTDVGLVLAYPLPRLRDGIPRIQERPQVALHGHSGPVRFLIPVQYGPLTGSPIRRRPESVLKKYKMAPGMIQNLPKVSRNSMNRKDSSGSVNDNEGALEQDNIYEEIEVGKSIGDNAKMEIVNIESAAGKNADVNMVGEGVYEQFQEVVKVGDDVVSNSDRNEVGKSSGGGGNDVDKVGNAEKRESELSTLSGEHNYFVLEPGASGGSPTGTCLGQVQGSNQGTQDSGAVFSDDSQNKSTGSVENSQVVADRTDFSQSADGGAVGALDDRGNDGDHVNRRVRGSGLHGRAFASELQEKITRRRSVEDLIDRDLDEASFPVLYPTLMKHQTLAPGFRPNSYERFCQSHEDSLYVRTGMTEPILSRGADYSSMRDLNRNREKLSKSKKNDTKGENKGEKGGKSKKKTTTVSFSEEDPPPKSRGKSSQVGTSFVGGSTLDTLMKQDSNTILVLSGGDGYKDWQKRQSLPNYRPEEPCMVFWMYKF